LTTHCQGDATRVVNDIQYLFDDKTVELLKIIKPTTWMNSSNKAEAIDFAKPFLWFDDNCLYGECQALAEHDVLENWIRVDLRNDPNQLGQFLQSFPAPTELIRRQEKY